MRGDYGTWFREQVEAAMREANDPKADWVSHARVNADMAALRNAVQRRIYGSGNRPSHSRNID
ncbi:hypothetical protein UE99_028490 [Burkholderia cenocepacia]|nr:hypothetical protein [Burkholderia cenocepacia]